MTKSRNNETRIGPATVGAVGVVISVGITIWLTIGDLATKTLVAVAVGMLVTVLVVLLDIVLRLHERAQRQDQHGRLLELIERQPPFLPIITEMLSSAVHAVANAEVPLFREAVERAVDDARLHLQELEQGRMHCAANDSRIMVAQWSDVSRQVRATTLATPDIPWWQSAIGASYLRLNESAIHRGVDVERVFLYDEEGPSLTALLERNHAIGVRVLVAKRADVPPDLRINVVIYDSALCVDEVVNADGDAIEFVYSTNRSDLARISTAYNRLCAYAHEWAPAVALRPVPIEDAELPRKSVVQEAAPAASPTVPTTPA